MLETAANSAIAIMIVAKKNTSVKTIVRTICYPVRLFVANIIATNQPIIDHPKKMLINNTEVLFDVE